MKIPTQVNLIIALLDMRIGFCFDKIERVFKLYPFPFVCIEVRLPRYQPNVSVSIVDETVCERTSSTVSNMGKPIVCEQGQRSEI